MAIVVEDGTGLSTAESYITVAYADDYHSDRAQTTWDGSDEDKEAALRRALAYLDGRYGPRFNGLRKLGRDQALMWPRVGATDSEGWVIDSDVIPPELKRAQAEAALRELEEPGFLAPDVSTAGSVTMVREKVGPLETETQYAATGSSNSSVAERTRPFIQTLDDLLAPLLRGVGGSFGSIPIVRA
jgi:hypothetical protein